MKKWLSYVLIFGLLLACVGCAGQEGETATDVSSVASQRVNAPVSGESSVSTESKPTESMPMESTPSQWEEKPSEENSKPEEEQPIINETVLKYAQVEGEKIKLENVSQQPYVVICRSATELRSYIQEWEMDVPWGEVYSSEYFKNNSLLLLTGDNSEYLLKKAVLSDDVLSVSWEVLEPMDTVTWYAVYPVEIYHSLERVKELQINTKYYIPDGYVLKKETNKTYAMQQEKKDSYSSKKEETLNFALRKIAHYKEIAYSPKYFLCSSVEDLNHYMETYQRLSFSWLEAYNEEYFKTNSLLVFHIDDFCLAIEKVTLFGGILLIDCKETAVETDNRIDLHVYPLEIHHKLSDVKAGKITIHGIEKDVVKPFFVN